MNGGTLERIRPHFHRLAEAAGLLQTEVSVRVEPLTPEEAIGAPTRRDYPILIGKERVIEARLAEARGHAFTDTARNFAGRLSDVIGLPLVENGDRAVYIAVLNATMRHLGRLNRTLHCRNDDPERCGADIVRTLRTRYGTPRIGLIGHNPAIAAHLVDAFGADHVVMTDLNPDNIDQMRHGVRVWDGAARTDELIDTADVVLVTGTTLVNGTFDDIWDRIAAAEKKGIVFGVTAAGVCELLGYDRICPFARDA